MKRAALLVLLAPLGACGLFKSVGDGINHVGDTIGGLTNPLVVQGIVLGVDAPQGDTSGLDLSDTDLKQGCALTVFLADASDPSQIEDAPVIGAGVDVSTAKGDVAATDEGDG